MKLTELKNEMIKAFRQHGDYDIKIITDDRVFEIEDCGIDSGRFNFYIEVDIPVVYEECEGYHIEDDDLMNHCSICSIYYQTDECPGCILKKLRKDFRTLLSGKLF